MEFEIGKYYSDGGDSSYYILYVTGSHAITVKYSSRHQSYDLNILTIEDMLRYNFETVEYEDFMENYDDYLVKFN